MTTDSNSTLPRPTLTKQEYNWAAHNAAMRARSAATAQGADPHAAEALLMAGCPPVLEIGGYSISPPGVGHLILLDKVRGIYAALEKDLQALGIALVLADPRKTNTLFSSGDTDEQKIRRFEEEMFEFTLRITTQDLEALSAWLEFQFALLGESEDAQTEPVEATEGNAQGPMTNSPHGQSVSGPTLDPAGF